MENLHVLLVVLRDRLARLRRVTAGETGVSTLEMVIIALGLMAVAGLLVAAITSAVTSRTNQLQ